MTSIAHQDVAQLGGAASILVRQRLDHQQLDVLLHQLELAKAGIQQETGLRRLARLVFPHAFAEESVLWPELRRVLPDGDALTLRVEREHQEVNELWKTLEERRPRGSERRDVIAQMCQVLREDVRDEEDELLPRLQDVTSVRRLRTLGLAWEVVRRTAPTRPHPVVSRRPPGNALAAVPLTVIDRSRDVLDGVGLRSPRLHRPASRMSGALATTAGHVERLRVLRVGEHDATRARGPVNVESGSKPAGHPDPEPGGSSGG